MFSPTVQTSLADSALTPVSHAHSEVPYEPCDNDHSVPSQCSITGSSPPHVEPTAHASSAARAVTPARLLSCPAGFRVATTVQRLPFQCSDRLLRTPCRSASPTAQMSSL